MTSEEPVGSRARRYASGSERSGSEMGKMAAAVGSVTTLVTEPGEDAFRKLFRFYRQSRPGTTDLGGVIDFSAAHAARGTGPAAHKVRREGRLERQRHRAWLGKGLPRLFSPPDRWLGSDPLSLGSELNSPPAVTRGDKALRCRFHRALLLCLGQNPESSCLFLP